jgi:hypothetical protein
VKTDYVFGLMEKDWNPETHELTGLIDKDERPIVRHKGGRGPLGFGRNKEWLMYDYAIPGSDTSEPPGRGEGGVLKGPEPGSTSIITLTGNSGHVPTT